MTSWIILLVKCWKPWEKRSIKANLVIAMAARSVSPMKFDHLITHDECPYAKWVDPKVHPDHRKPCIWCVVLHHIRPLEMIRNE